MGIHCHALLPLLVSQLLLNRFLPPFPALLLSHRLIGVQ